MTGTISAPLYLLRGLQLIGWRDMPHALDYLFADGALREGTLVAINAEKMLAVEDNPEVRALIEAAEFKYADGISVVRSLRKKYPQAQVSRVAGADLWEALMQRAGAEGTPVFLVGGKPEVVAQTESRLRQRWQVNIVGSQDGYFTLSNARHCSNAFATAGRKSSPSRWGRRARRSSCATAGACIRTRCIWASAALTMFLPGTSIGRRSSGRIWGWSGSIACFCSRAASRDSSAYCAIYVGIIPVSSDIPLQPGEFAYIFCVISSLA